LAGDHWELCSELEGRTADATMFALDAESRHERLAGKGAAAI